MKMEIIGSRQCQLDSPILVGVLGTAARVTAAVLLVVLLLLRVLVATTVLLLVLLVGSGHALSCSVGMSWLWLTTRCAALKPNVLH